MNTATTALVLFPLLAGCAEAPDFLDRSTAAWAARAVEEARPGLLLGVGVGGLAAELCQVDHGGWQDALASGFTLSEATASWFGVTPEGEVSHDAETGLFSVLFGDGLVQVTAGEEPVAAYVRVTATVPTEALGVEVVADLDAASDTKSTFLDLDVSTGECGTDSQLVAATVSPHAAWGTWTVNLPARDGDLAWMTFASPALLPVGGSVGWKGETGDGTVEILTSDAALATEGAWPVTVTGKGWSAEATVALP